MRENKTSFIHGIFFDSELCLEKYVVLPAIINLLINSVKLKILRFLSKAGRK